VLSRRQAALAARVKETFDPHRRRYGARRIAAHLKAEGPQAGRRRVRTLMRGLELQAIRPRRFVPRATDSRHGVAPSPNLLPDEGDAPRRPRAVLVGDITYLPLRTGEWGYLASRRDKFTRRVVGRAVAERMTEGPVITALEKAFAQGGVERGAIIHTDQGSRYVSNNYRAPPRAHGCRQSMSRRGNC
jgi:transposase InsO family protein